MIKFGDLGKEECAKLRVVCPTGANVQQLLVRGAQCR